MNMPVITLKRIVMVKAIVTQAFKENLVGELNRARDLRQQQLAAEETQAFQLVDNLARNGRREQAQLLTQQAEMSRAQHQQAILELGQKIDEANALDLDTEFVQGPLEGFVKVQIGDNLYKLVGGCEVIVKDGIVQEIRNYGEDGIHFESAA